jgi:hypothetical protein
VEAAILNVDQVRVRLGLSSRNVARRVMREMRHKRRGRDVWTTEEWLAEWLADGTKAMRDPLARQDMDPLEGAVKRMAREMIGELLPQLRRDSAA